MPEGGLGDLITQLLENPVVNQALHVAFEARDRASQAGQTAMRGVGVSSASEVDRLGRRLRALSERLEAVEDTLDHLAREIDELRASTPGRGSTREP
jgi:hypothetical protein